MHTDGGKMTFPIPFHVTELESDLHRYGTLSCSTYNCLDHPGASRIYIHTDWGYYITADVR